MSKFSKGDRVKLPGIPQPIEIDGVEFKEHSGTFYIDTDGESWYCQYVDKKGSRVSPVVEDADEEDERSEFDKGYDAGLAEAGRQAQSQGVPAWAVLSKGGGFIEAHAIKADAREAAKTVEGLVRPVRVIETDAVKPEPEQPRFKETAENLNAAQASSGCRTCGDKTEGRALFCRSHAAQFVEAVGLKYASKEPAQASDAEQAGETGMNYTVRDLVTRNPLASFKYLESAEKWRSTRPVPGCLEIVECAPTVPDAAGVESETTRFFKAYGEAWVNAAEDIKGALTRFGQQLSRNVEQVRENSQVRMPTFPRPVPAQLSLEDVALEAIEAALKPFGIVLPPEALHDAAGAVRAAFPELNEGGKR